jgi:hypothetical protein
MKKMLAVLALAPLTGGSDAVIGLNAGRRVV